MRSLLIPALRASGSLSPASQPLAPGRSAAVPGAFASRLYLFSRLLTCDGKRLCLDLACGQGDWEQFSQMALP